MSDSFPLLVLSLFLILHNVHCNWTVSEPFNQTMNGDGSISVTCMYEAPDNFPMDAKLKMNDLYICEIHNNQDNENCKWKNEGKNIRFTWMNPEHIHKSVFSCVISKVRPFPIITRSGPKVKLFQGCTNSVAPLNPGCTYDDKFTDPKPTKSPTEDTQILLICGLLIVVVMLSLYSIIITVAYLRVRVTRLEISDTLTYVPMQKNVKRRDPDNTEYMDMREVQKRGGPHRDMNHNSHMIPSV